MGWDLSLERLAARAAELGLVFAYLGETQEYYINLRSEHGGTPLTARYTQSAMWAWHEMADMAQGRDHVLSTTKQAHRDRRVRRWERWSRLN